MNNNTGQIVKAKFNGQGFTLIPNDALQDKKLSWQAKGLLGYLLSLPSDWVVYVSELDKNATNGRESSRGAFKELQDAGYILSVRIFEGNLAKGWSHIVYNSPQKPPEPPEPIGSSDIQTPVHTGSRHSEKPPLQINNTTKETKKTKETVPPFSEFLNYAIENKKDVDETDLRFKYSAWVANDWCTGKNKHITRWKSTLLQTLPYIKSGRNYKHTPMVH